MNWYAQRPAMVVALLFAAGILCSSWLEPVPYTPLVGAVGALLLALAWGRGRAWLLVAGIFMAGAAEHAFRTGILSPTDLRVLTSSAPQLASVRGVLRKTPESQTTERGDKLVTRSYAEMEVTEVKVDRAPWQLANGAVAVMANGLADTNFYGGQTVEFSGVLSQPPGAVVEGMVNYRALLERRDIHRQLNGNTGRDWKRLHSPATPPVFDRFRDWAEAALERGLPKDESVILQQALAVGDRQLLTAERKEPFVQASTYHIFAVDGLRLAIVFGIFFALARALRIPKVTAGLMVLPVVWGYAALTGWPASAIRAAVMLSVVVGGWWWRRPTDLFNSLFLAAIIILVWNPQQLFEAGFQMSFLVVFAILLLMPPLDALALRLLRVDPLVPPEGLPRWKRWSRGGAHLVLDLVLVSFAAWVGSIPLTAYYFNLFTPVSVPANVLAVPACALVLICNFVSLLFAGWLPSVSELFNHSGWMLMEGIRTSSIWCTHWPYAYQYVAKPGWPDIAAYYLLLTGLCTGWLWREGRWWKLPVCGVIAVVWGWNFYLRTATTQLSILPLGAGSAVYCDAPGKGSDVLVDCGNEVPADFTLKPFLHAQGVDQLSRLVLTHGDGARVAGAGKVIHGFNPGEIITSHAQSHSPAYRDILMQLKNEKRPWKRMAQDDSFGSWRVLHPAMTDKFGRADDNALVLFGGFQSVRVLLLSDLGTEGQEALLERQPDLQAEVVVAGIPQRGEPLSNRLLNRINPQLIIITDATTPPERRASDELKERLGHWGVPVIYLRESGAVRLDIDSGSWEASAMNGKTWKF